MRASIIYFVGISLILSMNRCIPDPLPVDNIAKPVTKIVVSSQMVPNVGLVVLVTRTVSALEAGRDTDINTLLQQIVINDAIVTLNYGNNLETLQNRGSGLYSSANSQWTTGVEYTLNVVTPLFGEVTSTALVPQQVAFASVGIKLYSTGYDSLLQVDYGLNDPSGKNFYMVSVQKFSMKQDVQSLLNPKIFTHLTDDLTFDGKRFDENFKTLFQDFSKGDSVAVVMANVSEGYYKFLKLRNDRFRFSDFSSEPLNYPSNIQGGYGFFNLHVPDVRVFVVK